MNFNSLQQALWISPVLLMLAIVWKMAVSDVHRTFPFFFRYAAFQIFTWILLNLLGPFITPLNYLYAYTAAGLVGAALGFAAIYEIFSNVFRPYEALRDFAAVMFRWAGLVLLLVAVIQALSTKGNEASQLMHALLIAQRSFSVIACGLLLFLLLFSKNLGLNWKNRTFGIALGFGFCAGIELVLWTLRIQFGIEWTDALNFGRSISLNLSIMLWTYYMFSPERARQTAEAFAPKLILERWNQVLRSVNRPAVPQGTFMPNLEKIVDDVMAHRPTGTVH